LNDTHIGLSFSEHPIVKRIIVDRIPIKAEVEILDSTLLLQNCQGWVYTKIPEDKRETRERKQKGLEAQKGISI
jgi:hypothetical protein